MVGAAPSQNVTDSRAWTWNAKRKQAALLRAKGETWDAIAAATGYSSEYVRHFAESLEFVERVDELSSEPIEEAMLVLRKHARRAAETVVWVMENGEAKRDEPRLAAAQDILDRLGVAAGSEAESPQPIIAELNVDLDITIIDAAQRAYVRALRDATAEMGSGVYASAAPIEGAYEVRALPVPGGFPAGPEPGADGAEGAADWDESDRGT